MGNWNICLFIDDCAGLSSIRIRIRFDSIPRQVDSRIPEVYKNLNRMSANCLCRYVSFESIFLMAVDRAEWEDELFDSNRRHFDEYDNPTDHAANGNRCQDTSHFAVWRPVAFTSGSVRAAKDRLSRRNAASNWKIYPLFSADVNRHRLPDHNPNPNPDPCPMRWGRLGEVENVYVAYINFSDFVIYLPKLIKIGWNLWKF